jgi:SAM-dependent methyltransferase
MGEPAVTSAEYEAKVSAAWSGADPATRSWWQSPVVLSEIQRRITGDPGLSPQRYFAGRYAATPFASAVSLGCGGGQLERELVELGACEELLGLDLSEERIRAASDRVPPELRGRLRFERANIEAWTPPAGLDLVVAHDVLHHITGLERLLEELSSSLGPSGLLYVDEFVGPARFQWTDKQLEIINRLLGRLGADLKVDLAADGTRLRDVVRRPDKAGMIASDPSEAARSDEIPQLLERWFEPLEKTAYGGAVFHQLFNRIMGNFAGHDDLVRTLMEIDFLLTDEGVVETNYVWGVYRPRPGA